MGGGEESMLGKNKVKEHRIGQGDANVHFIVIFYERLLSFVIPPFL